MINRRDFIRNSVALAALTLPSSLVMAHIQSGSKIRVGVIGLKGMGWSNLMAILKIEAVECVALCDIDDNILASRKDELAKRNINPKLYKDYKELLATKEVDAVIIATPDHWHCLMAVAACEVGKAVYVEKPIANSIAECNIMLAVAQKNNAIVQVGQWQRSQKHFKDAIDYVHSGKLGNIRLVKAWAYLGGNRSVPKQENAQVPAGVDYDKWLGPAQKRPFNVNRFHYHFRWFWDYAGGLMTDWGVHLLDYALLGMKASDPKSIMASGGKFAYPQDDGETPDTLTTVYEFESFNIQWEHAVGIDQGLYGRGHGIAFIGNNGTLVLNREGWEVIPEKGNLDPVLLQKRSDNGLDLHMINFIEAIQAKDPQLLHAPLIVGANICKFSHMGNIAYRTGMKINWNGTKQRFLEPEANKLLTAAYHNGYKLPKT